MALAIGSAISFTSMVMASLVGETQALRLHATELMLLLGTAIVLLVERPARPETGPQYRLRRSIPSAAPTPEAPLRLP